MLNFKKIFLILAGVLILSASAEARVCFLAGSDDDEGCLTTSSFEGSAKCPGYATCSIPAIGASACGDGGTKLYKPEDCCTDGSIFERCDGEGQVCKGASCTGYDEDGNLYEACEIGYCGCGDSYTEKCTGNGLVGVGEPCGGLYQSCQCSGEYYACDADAIKSGSSCNDGTQKYTSCTCPTPDGGTWVTDPDECCFGYSSTCVNYPGGDRVYKCNSTPIYNCTCGFSYASTTKSCINGCTDDAYDYQGNIPAHVVCNDYVNGIKGKCGADCQCEDGYWDFVEECTAQKSTVCQDLGYTDKSCDGAWIACPYDVSAKKCLDTGGGYDEEKTCPTGQYATQEECMGLVAVNPDLELKPEISVTPGTSTSRSSLASSSDLVIGGGVIDGSVGVLRRCVQDATTGCWYRSSSAIQQCSDGYTYGLKACTQDSYGCTYFLEDSANEDCGQCYQTTACRNSGYYCSQEVCEAETGKTCSAITDFMAYDTNFPGSSAGLTGRAITCYRPTTTTTEPKDECCAELGITSGIAYTCIPKVLSGQAQYPLKCSVTNVSDSIYTCTAAICGESAAVGGDVIPVLGCCEAGYDWSCTGPDGNECFDTNPCNGISGCKYMCTQCTSYTNSDL